jgi:proteasome lid subunit RPN8/RPN11
MSILKDKKNKTKQVNKEWRIEKECLNLIFESAKSAFPNEFGALLRVDDDLINTISELVLLPGTISGNTHAIFKMYMSPIDFSLVGTVHSHPSYSYRPSNADLQLFQKYGKIHIITAYPFKNSSWRAYKYNGKELNIEVI